MTKRRKRPGSAAPPQTPPRNAPEQTEADTKAFAAELEALFGRLLEHGCPCRFPRFRATVSRDTREVGAPNFTTWEQQALVSMFDLRVPLRDREARPVGHDGHCALCGAAVERWGEEPFRSAWIEYLKITPAPGVEDVGAEVHTAVPHCWPFFSAAPQEYQRNLEHMVALHYPRVSRQAWLDWIGELRDDASQARA
jgi:hypothetical protein